MKRLKIALLLLFIFLAGATTGSIVTRMVVKRRNFDILQEIKRKDFKPIADRIFARLNKRLKLNPGQKEPIRATIEGYLNDVAELTKQKRPKMAEILEKSIAKMKRVLYTAQ